ncbi:MULTISPECIES: hypothetical protein [Microcoleaceae]|nr:hypothetical protein [Tychonema sp. LEGE 06208]MBE9163937.1 hypothetical protein [Tychonema sp. LEGE 06208]
MGEREAEGLGIPHHAGEPLYVCSNLRSQARSHPQKAKIIKIPVVD